MRVGVLGINHKLADLSLRETLAKICYRRLHPGQSTHGDHSFVLLSTCNRTEVYFSSEDLADTHSYLLGILRHEISEDFDQKLYSYFGQDCLLHLCRVTAGLDSAIIAETEIQGQVKQAYEAAQRYQKLPYEMHYLFQKSLGIAKRARTLLPAKPGLPDIGHAIAQTGQHLAQGAAYPSILFVGASDINEKILAYFKSRGFSRVTLCNRTHGAMANMAEKYAVETLSWDRLCQWDEYDWIIFGTKAPDYLLKAGDDGVEWSGRKLIIDLAVPRNVDPLLARNPNITLLNIDQINRRLKVRRKSLSHCLHSAEQMIADTIADQMKLFHEKEKSRLRFCLAG